MNKDTLQGNWDDVKGKIKAKWGKLTDNEIDTFKGNLDQISGKIQAAYGYAKDKAELEFNEFRQSLAGKANQAIDQSDINGTKNNPSSNQTEKK